MNTMTTESYPYSTAHKHTIDLIEEVNNLEDPPLKAILLLANVASMLSNKVRELQ